MLNHNIQKVKSLVHHSISSTIMNGCELICIRCRKLAVVCELDFEKASVIADFFFFLNMFSSGWVLDTIAGSEMCFLTVYFSVMLSASPNLCFS